MVDHKQISKRLPGDWSELTLADFMKTLDIMPDEDVDTFSGVDNAIQVISRITDTPVDALEELKLPVIQELIHKISFIGKSFPETQKQSKLKWKNIESISYSDFVTFQTVTKDPNKQLEHLPSIIQTFSIEPLTIDQVMALDMQTCWTGFFLLERNVRRYVKHTATSLRMKLMKQMIRETVTHCRLKWLKPKDKSNQPMDGFF
jgi:hypothetical protein